MRIRKNMKLSSLLLATTGYGGETPETYLCQLNQSPWDVIQMTSHGDAELSNLVDSSWFLPSPSSSSSSPILVGKVDGEEANVKVSLGDSNGVLKSSVERINLNAEAEEDYESERSPGFEEPMDQSSDDKKSKSKFVELELDSSDEFSVPKRGRPRGTGKKTPAASTTTAAANPYEFYYYSGFGPRWGRKRGTGENVIQNDENRMGDWTTTSFEQDNSDHGTTTIRKPKRGRKPVKERSLKSLM